MWRVRDGQIPQRVLLVDDDPGVLEVLRAILEAGGYSVTIASGAEAAARLADGSDGIDLLITELQLREKSGVELADEFARIKPDLPVLFIAASAPHEKLLREARKRTIMYKPSVAHYVLENVQTILNSP